MRQTHIRGKRNDNGNFWTGEWENDCGTPGCAAGWIAGALKAEWRGREGYRDGIEAVDAFLGFRLREDFAQKYADLWGNSEGHEIFAHGRGWGQTSDVFPPTVLVNHLRAVAGRIEESLGNKEVKQKSKGSQARDGRMG